MSTPTTKEISARILSKFDATFGESLPKSFLRVLSTVLAGVFVILYKYGGFIALQMFVSTASAKDTDFNGKTINPLKEWGRLIGAGDPNPAQTAIIKTRIVVEMPGDVLPAGTQLVNSNNGVTYITQSDIVLIEGSQDIDVLAASDTSGGSGAGKIGNLNPGDSLSFANPLGSVARASVVVSIVREGVDAETVESYRARVYSRFQARAQGGAMIDYKLWGESVSGVNRIYPYTSNLPGQVDLYVDALEGEASQALLTEVKNAVEFETSNGLAQNRPINAVVNYLPIKFIEFNVKITGLSVENLLAVKTEIRSNLENYFKNRAPYIVGLSVEDRADRITLAAVSGVVDDVVNKAGGIFYDLQLYKGVNAVSFYMLGIGERSVLINVEYLAQ